MALLDKATNIFGPLDSEIKCRILAFMEAPNQETWDDINGIAIRPFKTIWQAVLRADPTFPKTGKVTDVKGRIIKPWPRIPDPMLVARAIKAELG